MAQRTQNRRLAPRLPCTQDVSFRVPARSPKQGWGQLIDVSPGGVQIESRVGLLVGLGESVELWIVPDKEAGELGLQETHVHGIVRSLSWDSAGQRLNLEFDPTKPGWHAWLRFAGRKLRGEMG